MGLRHDLVQSHEGPAADKEDVGRIDVLGAQLDGRPSPSGRDDITPIERIVCLHEVWSMLDPVHAAACTARHLQEAP